MAKKIGSFGTRRQTKAVEDVVEFCGEELKLQRVDGYALAQFTEVIGTISGLDVETEDGMASAIGMFSAATEFLDKVIAPESLPRLKALAEENAVGLSELFEMAMSLFGWASAFPTEGQSGSSVLPQINGPSPNDSFSLLSAQLNESGTSE